MWPAYHLLNDFEKAMADDTCHRARIDKPDWVVDIELPYSEVCMHMKVAGKIADIELLPNNMAQIYFGAEKFSMPVTRGEAGVPYDG
jgi:hypothetical protein